MAALAGIVFAKLGSGLPFQRRYLAAALTLWAAIQVGPYWSESVLYRDYSRFAHGLLHQAGALCRDLPPATTIMFEDMPLWEGQKVFNNRDLVHALEWWYPGRALRPRLGHGQPGERTLVCRAGRLEWRSP